jgi:hypothetical protein
MKRALDSGCIAQEAVRQCVDQTLGLDDHANPLSIVRLFRLRQDLKRACVGLLPAAGLLASLPAELFFMVLDHCSVKAWSALARTCRHLFQLVTQRTQDYCGRFGFSPQKTSLQFLANYLFHCRGKLQKYTKVSKRCVAGSTRKFEWHLVYLAASPVLCMTPECLIRKIIGWNDMHVNDFLITLDITPDIVRRSGLLFWATWNGHIPILNHLMQNIGVVAQDFLFSEHGTTALELGVGSRRIDTVRFLFETVGLTAQDARSVKVLAQLMPCREGSARKMLEEHYNFAGASLLWCLRPSMDVIPYLFETVKLTLDDARVDQIWHQAVVFNHNPDVVMYLVDKMGLPNEDLRGAFHLIQPGSWLVRHFFEAGRMTVDDIRANNNRLLRGCAYRIHDLRYLFQVVGLTIEDARADDNGALWNAIYYSDNRFDSVRYLFEVVGLTADDFRSADNRILRDCFSRSDKLGMIKYLFKRVGLTAEDARANNNEALNTAAMYFNLKYVKYLVEKVGLGRADIQRVDLDALRQRAPSGHSLITYLERISARR